MRKNQINILIIVSIIALIMFLFPPFQYYNNHDEFGVKYKFLNNITYSDYHNGYNHNTINKKMLHYQYIALCFAGAIALLIEYRATKK